MAAVVPYTCPERDWNLGPKPLSLLEKWNFTSLQNFKLNSMFGLLF